MIMAFEMFGDESKQHYTSLHYAVLHCIALHYTALHCTALSVVHSQYVTSLGEAGPPTTARCHAAPA